MNLISIIIKRVKHQSAIFSNLSLIKCEMIKKNCSFLFVVKLKGKYEKSDSNSFKG